MYTLSRGLLLYSIPLIITVGTNGAVRASGAVTGPSRAVTGASRAVLGASGANTGASTAVTGASTAVTEASTAVTAAPRAVTGASDAVTGASTPMRPVGAQGFPSGQQYLTLANGQRIPIMMGAGGSRRYQAATTTNAGTIQPISSQGNEAQLAFYLLSLFNNNLFTVFHSVFRCGSISTDSQ